MRKLIEEFALLIMFIIIGKYSIIISSRFVIYFGLMWITKCWFCTVCNNLIAVFFNLHFFWQPHCHEWNYFRYSQFCGRSGIMSVNTIFVRWNYSFVLYQSFGSWEEAGTKILSYYFIYWLKMLNDICAWSSQMSWIFFHLKVQNRHFCSICCWFR